MSREWIALVLGVITGGVFSSILWTMMPVVSQNSEVTLYYHQVGIYANASNAENASEQVEAIGLDAYTLHKDGQSIIICGLVFSEEESQAIEASLQGAGLPVLEKQEIIGEDLKKAVANDDVTSLLEELESR